MRKVIRYCSALLVCVLVAAAFAVSVCAVGETTNLDISFLVEEKTTPLPDANIYIYKLADLDPQTGDLVWYDDYADYVFDLSRALDSEQIARAAQLAEFIAGQSGLTPMHTLVTNDRGIASAAVESGLYLICGDSAKLGDKTYTPTPFLLRLPYTDSDGNPLETLYIEIKYTVEELEVSPSPTPTSEPEKSPDPTTTPEPEGSPAPTSTPGPVGTPSPTPANSGDVPQTGDEAPSLWLYLIMFSACAAGIMFVVIRRRSKLQ